MRPSYLFHPTLPSFSPLSVPLSLQIAHPKRCLWVGWKASTPVSAEEIETAFSRFGRVADLRFNPDRHCAFVDFDDERAAAEAMRAVHGAATRSGGVLKVELAKSGKVRGERRRVGEGKVRGGRWG